MVENFFHQFFIRENYIKMLIQIICKKNKKNGVTTKFVNLAQVIERHREKLNKKNAEITNLNRKAENLKKELDYSKINMNEYKVNLFFVNDNISKKTANV